MFSTLIDGIENVVSWISGAWTSFAGIFSDIDFSLLYDWLPSDIQAVVAACITVLFFIAIIGLIKKLVLFLG